ncbi:MAG: Crp/Fnr family transcriptional regulator [Bacteroidota bacterium]|nr:Crp/Fnr family transcriptional regulator [Bacteroidota bacterium]
MAYFERNSVILQSGDTQAHLYCIREGWCRIVYGDSKEKPSTLWYAGPGDLLGLSSICSGEKNSFSVVAIDNITACRISAADFQQLLPAVKGLSLRIAKQLSGEIERLEKRTSALHRRFIQKETARNILHILKKSGSAKGKKISLLSLARKIDASRNEIKDSLTAFVLNKLIRHEEGKITITDKDRLLLVAMNDDEWN